MVLRRRFRPLRWTLAVLALVSVALTAMAAPLACTTRVIPPAAPHDPVPLFLLDHGRTPSLVLPTTDGQLLRFVYGDWNYYALGNRGPTDALAALFWPTTGTLGMHRMSGPATVENLQQQLRVETDHIYRLQVERHRAEHLAQRLQALLNQQPEVLVYSPGNQSHFGHHPRRYTYFHNSNHETADWLAELGCTLRGPAFNSRWHVEPPGGEVSAHR